MKTQTKRRGNAGVTLIEMLVVVTIIGLIATLVAVNVFKQAEGAKRKLDPLSHRHAGRHQVPDSTDNQKNTAPDHEKRRCAGLGRPHR